MDDAGILDECLEAIARGETEESCLARYPERAMELGPLLRTAMAARGICAVTPDPEFRARARNEYRRAVAEVCAKATKRGFRWSWSWSTAVPLAAAVVLMLSGGVLASSMNALPGQPLYGIKLATEGIQIKLTPAGDKVNAYSLLTERRLEEIVVLAERGDFVLVDQSLLRLDEALDEVTEYLWAGIPPSSRQFQIDIDQTLLCELQGRAVRGIDTLQALSVSVPDNTQEKIRHVLESYNDIIKVEAIPGK